jgi:hypothetical protein
MTVMIGHERRGYDNNNNDRGCFGSGLFRWKFAIIG